MTKRKLNKEQKEIIENIEKLGKPIIDPYSTKGSNVIMVRENKKCELCGKVDETRPYGPNGEEICYNCGMKNEKITIRMMNKILFGEND
jgi:hypothetical protein